jgi:ABC-type multidrug transport system ATPase subunit
VDYRDWQLLQRKEAVPSVTICDMGNPILVVQGLRKQYGPNTVVNDVSLTIEAGECLGVIGPNGAGKTTTVRMCLGLTHPDEGQICYSLITKKSRPAWICPEICWRSRPGWGW